MSTIPTKVQPGDLITSEFMNNLLDVCSDLQDRVSRLETPGTSIARTKITDLLPTGTLRIGDTLHIIGVGFNAPGGSSVLIDSLQVLATPGADRDKELIVTIPNIQGIGGAGKTVTVLVSNLNGSDTRDFQVFQALPTVPQGNLFVSLKSSPAGNLTAGTSPIFEYTVRGIITLGERFNVSASTADGWACNIVDGSNVPIANPTIDLAAVPPPNGDSVTVRVQVTIPAAPTVNTTQLTLMIASTRNVTLTGASGGEQLTLNASGPTPEPISISLDVVAATDPNSQPAPTVVNNVVKIPAGAGSYRITFNAKPLTPNSTYTKHIDALSDPRWTASFRRTSSVTDESLGPVTDGTLQTFFVFVTAASGAPAITLPLRLFSQSNANDKGHVNQAIATA